MKLSRLRQDIADGYGFIMVNKEVVARFERKEAEELLADIDAEIAKARGEHHEGAAWALMVIRRLEALERGQTHGVGSGNEQDERITALESSEVELRQHCQGNVPMSVFNDLKERVESMSDDLTSLENQVARELRALPERVKAIEVGERATGKFDEDEAYDEWPGTPWPPSMDGKHERSRLEQAFREGFRAGRK